MLRYAAIYLSISIRLINLPVERHNRAVGELFIRSGRMCNLVDFAVWIVTEVITLPVRKTTSASTTGLNHTGVIVTIS